MKQHTPEEFEAEAKRRMRRWAFEGSRHYKNFVEQGKDFQIEILEGLRQAGFLDRDTDILALDTEELRVDAFCQAMNQ